MNPPVRTAAITRCDETGTRTDQVLLAVESPLILTVTQGERTHSLGVLMRTPGDDVDLAVGLLHAEAVIRTAEEIRDVRTSAGPDPDQEPIGAAGAVELTARVDVVVADGVDLVGIVERPPIATSACGLCGRAAHQALTRRAAGPPLTVTRQAIAALPDRLRAHQAVFSETGALHAAALIDAEAGGDLVREDVGRHNAVDKVIGAALRTGRLGTGRDVLVVSGRLAYEIVQKAAIAGIQIIVAVGAPSSLAVDAARAAGITLVGFAREGRFNVYAGIDRVRDR